MFFLTSLQSSTEDPCKTLSIFNVYECFHDQSLSHMLRSIVTTLVLQSITDFRLVSIRGHAFVTVSLSNHALGVLLILQPCFINLPGHILRSPLSTSVSMSTSTSQTHVTVGSTLFSRCVLRVEYCSTVINSTHLLTMDVCCLYCLHQALARS